jgi:diaminopimelate epimerase
MRIQFTKMQGAGNDFVVLDETRGRLGLSAAHYRFLGDRHFGVGADQILTVRPSPAAGVDFEYIIHNSDGAEVEQCGNGSRCFARFVRDRGLTTKDTICVQTRSGIIAPHLTPDGRVTVDMGAPRFDLADIPFDGTGLEFLAWGSWGNWMLPLIGYESGAPALIAPISMGNPHGVLLVDDVEAAPLATLGPAVQASPRFPQGVNVGFMQVINRRQVKLRVYERGVGETLACGTGACAAAVAGMRLGLLDSTVDIQARGGVLTIAWAGEMAGAVAGASGQPVAWAPVMMTGPATTVFQGEIDIPDTL